MKLLERLASEFFNYSDGIRFLMLTNRKQGGKNSKDKNKIFKLTSYDRESFINQAIKLKTIGDKIYISYRIYASLNNRNLKKAIYMFKRKMIEAEFRGDDRFYLDFYNQWISALMKPESKRSKFYLIDIDNVDQITEVKKRLSQITKNFTTHLTPNGYHIYSQPFDVRILSDLSGVDIKKDGLMLIYWK